MTDIADVSPNLGLPFYQTKQNEFEVQHNEALLRLDALVMLAVIDRDLSAPPSSPAYGDRYLVKPTASGAFAGQDDRIAQYDVGGWNFYAPQPGWTCYVRDEQHLLAWNGSAWHPALDVLGGVTELQNLNLLGVGTSADSGNPLAAKLNNALWAAKSVGEGGDGSLRYKLSKEDSAKTLSLLFQDNYSGRAEIGLTGDDDLHFKTSPDGNAWVDALTLDKASGAARLNSALCLTGDLSPAQLGGDQNDYSPSGLATASVLRLSSDASRNLTGLAGGADGRLIAIVNVGANAVMLKDASTASTAANRFAFGADLTIAAKQSAILWYDSTDSRWKLLAGPQTAGGAPADLDILLVELALGLADAVNVAQFLGASGNRFADSFDALTYVDVAGATNLDAGAAGLLKPTVNAPSTAYANAGGTGNRTSSITVTSNIGGDGGTTPAALVDGTAANNVSNAWDPVQTLNDGDYVKFDFGSGAAKFIDEIKLYANNAPGGAFKFQASGDGSTWTDGASFTWSSATQTVTIAGLSAAGYRYYRLVKNGAATLSDVWWHEVEFKIGAGASGTNNLTVKSTTLTAAAAPSAMKVVARIKPIDSVALGTDLVFAVSRDGGATFTNASMTDRFTAANVHVLESASIDVSAQPSGTSVKWRITTANNKSVEIHDLYLYWS